MKRDKKPSFARALRTVRKARGVSQEAFDTVSSRTYISVLERGLKQPTLPKIQELATVLGVHPLTLLTLCFCAPRPRDEVLRTLARIAEEIDSLRGD